MNNIKKKFLFFILFFTLIISNSYAEIVKKIEVMGNERISKETIIVFADISLGKDYEKKDLNSIIKKLYDTTFFSNISASLENNKLVITVKENPIINTIVFDGEDAKKYREKIEEIITLREKSSFIESNINTDINVMKNFYKAQGNYFVKIDATIEKLEKNRVNIVYKIDKGKKAKISKIYFLGEKKIREKRLRDVITSQEDRFWKLISNTVFLNKDRIELDKRLLENYYKNKGYYEVDIKTTNVEYAEGSGFVLTYNIEAGPRYKFRKIFADITDSLDKNAFLSLEKEFTKLSGKYYSQKKLKGILDKIDKLSEQKELQFITHNIEETLENEVIDVQINIFEGEKVIIERINIVGNSVTNDSVIRSALIVDEGDPFSTLLVNKSINEIKARNIFGKVEHTILAGSSDDLKILEISVEERATGEIMAGAGIGTDGTSFSFSVSENNWLGKGVKLKSALNVSQTKVAGNISINNPNYKFSNNSLSAGIDVSSTDQTNTSGYKSSRTGFDIGTAFEQYERVYIAPSITVAFEDIETDSSASTSFKKMEGNFFNADLGYAVTLDRRNQSFRPTDGHKITFRQKLPIVQDSSSVMNGIDISTYHGFSEDLIGSFKLHARAITGVDDDVRLTDRLFIPRNRLRGFNTYKVGPKDGEDWIGGNYTTALSTEAQLPNLLPESYRTDITLFFDTANIWGVDYTQDLEDADKIRTSVGFSADIFTAIGPLSFVVAKGITKATNDETQTFNFRLGTSF